LERIFDNEETVTYMRQGFMEGSRNRRSEARICKGFTLAEEEIGNRYRSRKKRTIVEINRVRHEE